MIILLKFFKQISTYEEIRLFRHNKINYYYFFKYMSKVFECDQQMLKFPDRITNQQFEKFVFLSNITQSTQRYDHQFTNHVFQLNSIISNNNDLFSYLLLRNSNVGQSIDNICNLLVPKSDQSRKKYSKMEKIPKQRSKQSETLKFNIFGLRIYKYSLQLKQNLSKQLYKQRNFNIYFNLVDFEGNQIKNYNPIPIALCAYQNKESPQIILENKLRKPIFKGNCESKLMNGIGSFEKIQFREVTSNYPKHNVYFVIFAKIPSFNYALKENQDQVNVLYQQIQPLIIEGISVKSKKL